MSKYKERFELRYHIKTPTLPGWHENVRRAVNHVWNEVFTDLVKKLELHSDDVTQCDDMIHCTTDWGWILVRENKGGALFNVLADKSLPRKEFKAGNLALNIVRTIQEKVYAFPQRIRVYHGTGHKMRRIDDLVAVNVDTTLGGNRKTVVEYAIPLHYYTDMTLVRNSENVILDLENETVTELRKSAGKKERITLKTMTEKLWDAVNGVKKAYFTGELTEGGQAQLQLYRQIPHRVVEHT